MSSPRCGLRAVPRARHVGLTGVRTYPALTDGAATGVALARRRRAEAEGVHDEVRNSAGWEKGKKAGDGRGRRPGHTDRPRAVTLASLLFARTPACEWLRGDTVADLPWASGLNPSGPTGAGAGGGVSVGFLNVANHARNVAIPRSRRRLGDGRSGEWRLTVSLSREGEPPIDHVGCTGRVRVARIQKNGRCPIVRRQSELQRMGSHGGVGVFSQVCEPGWGTLQRVELAGVGCEYVQRGVLP